MLMARKLCTTRTMELSIKAVIQDLIFSGFDWSIPHNVSTIDYIYMYTWLLTSENASVRLHSDKTPVSWLL